MSPINYWENKLVSSNKNTVYFFGDLMFGLLCEKLNCLNDLKRNFPKFVIDRLL